MLQVNSVLKSFESFWIFITIQLQSAESTPKYIEISLEGNAQGHTLIFLKEKGM